jgi:hypothetical protein
MNIGFHVGKLGERGTQVAVYDYAHYNEEYLGNTSYIFSDIEGYDERVRTKFKDRFEKRLLFYSHQSEIDTYILFNGIKVYYSIKSGTPDNNLSKHAKNAVHAVFDNHPHGNVYAHISKWLANQYKNPLWVPHMINLPDVNGDMRGELGIPKDSTVFGSYAGKKSFDISFVKNKIPLLASDKRWFIFANIEKFTDHHNVIFLDAIIDMEKKVKFINTCDAMLHARTRGETFGIAVGEFSIKNKPIFTWDGSPEKAHIDILGDKALLYNQNNFQNKIMEFFPSNDNWDCYSAEYNPHSVMDRFKKVFL